MQIEEKFMSNPWENASIARRNGTEGSQSPDRANDYEDPNRKPKKYTISDGLASDTFTRPILPGTFGQGRRKP